MTTHSTPLPLVSWQRNLIAVSWLSYAAYYLGRVNLSPALPDMEVALGLSKYSLGLLGTGFFWTYAIGQLINGQLGDLISPRRLVFVGMVASAILNLAFSTISVFPLLLLCWSINGFFQATGWAPILRILANWLSVDQRRRISTLFGTSYVLGNAASLLLAGYLVTNFGWRMAFRVPAILFLGFALFWVVAIRDTPEESGRERSWYSEPNKKSLQNIQSIFAGVGQNFRTYWPLALVALFVGFCLIALNTWLPTYFVEVGGVEISQAAALSALTPIAGSVGVVLISILINRYFVGKEVNGLVLTLGILIVLFAIFPWLPTQLTVATIGLMVIGAFISATSSLTLSTLPLVLGGQEDTSSLAGLIGLSTNIGAGLSTAVIGVILERFNWDAVFYSLALASFIALLFVALAIYRFQRKSLLND